MGYLAEAICAEQNVLDAWNTTLERLSSEPTQLREVTRFRANLLENLSRISGSLRDGSWQPGPLRSVPIPKADGGTRMLRIPSLADRVAERAVASVLSAHVDRSLQPDSYAYRPGLGVADALRALQERVEDGEQWVVRADVRDCFDSVSKDRCLLALADLVDDPQVLTLVERCVRREVGRDPRLGVPQGSPLSPLLVNVLLDLLDRELFDRGVSVIRYADDMCATATTKEDAVRQLIEMHCAAARHGVELSPSKSTVVRAGDGVPFLGQVVKPSGQFSSTQLVDPSRATIHITTRGSVLRATGTKFAVSSAGSPTVRYAAARTRMIVCCDRVLITSAAIALASRTGVQITVVDTFSNVTAFVTAGTSRHTLVAAQHRAASDGDTALLLAKAFVSGKIANSRVLLTRTKARRDRADATLIQRLDGVRARVAEAENVASLSGFEGAAARTYFEALSALVGPEWGFHRRTKRPPRDPVNAMLSYGYAILAAEARRAVELAGLDPSRGFLHAEFRDRPSLACDLMEEFRALIVDTSVLRLVNTRAVSPGGFDVSATGCRMDTRTKRALVEEIERRMLTRIVHPGSRRAMSYREAIAEQALGLARYVAGSASTYTPMPWR